LCRDLEIMAAPGRHYNYSNAGYAVLGRVIECVRGQSFDRAIADYIFARAALARPTTHAAKPVSPETAAGHGANAEGKMAVVAPIALPRGLGPAGLTLFVSAEELTAFAGAHMSGGALLSEASARAMATPEVALPENASWGLGWKIIA